MEFRNLSSFQNLNNTDVAAELKNIHDGIYIAKIIPSLYSIVS